MILLDFLRMWAAAGQALIIAAMVGVVILVLLQSARGRN